MLDPKAFAIVFAEWVGEVLPKSGHVAIDGKSLRGARCEGGRSDPSGQRLCH